MLGHIESMFDDVNIQSQSLEQDYAIPQQQTQIKDIQLRTQRVSRLIQVDMWIYLLIINIYFVFRKHLNILIKYLLKKKNLMIFLID